MTQVPPPDWAALYQKHRDAMYRVAARTLRSAGRTSEVEDVVMRAMVSLMERPPQGVKNWEAMMVKVTILRALDLLKSAAVKHSSAVELADHDGAILANIEDDVIEAVDRRRASILAWEKLSLLDERHRKAVVEYVAKERPRKEVAEDLGVTPGRVNQLATEALLQLREALEEEGVTP